jgi:hypothetical protein
MEQKRKSMGRFDVGKKGFPHSLVTSMENLQILVLYFVRSSRANYLVDIDGGVAMICFLA